MLTGFVLACPRNPPCGRRLGCRGFGSARRAESAETEPSRAKAAGCRSGSAWKGWASTFGAPRPRWRRNGRRRPGPSGTARAAEAEGDAPERVHWTYWRGLRMVGFDTTWTQTGKVKVQLILRCSEQEHEVPLLQYVFQKDFPRPHFSHASLDVPMAPMWRLHPPRSRASRSLWRLWRRIGMDSPLRHPPAGRPGPAVDRGV